MIKNIYLSLCFSYLKKRMALIAIPLGYIVLLFLNHFAFLSWTPYCLIQAGLGTPCLGCGTNRAILALLNGEILASWHLNPLGILFIIVGFILILLDFKKQIQLKKLSPCKT